MSRTQSHADTERLRATVLRHLSLDLPPFVREPVAASAVRWLTSVPSCTRTTTHGHLRLSPAATHTLDRVKRALVWMSDQRHHHGGEASAMARKTLRAAEEGRVDFLGLVGLCDLFQRRRNAAIRARALHKPRTAALTVALPRTEASASQITSEAALAALGREAGNCLASLDPGDRHRRDLRAGDAEFWRIADADGQLLVAARTGPSDAMVEEALGPWNAAPTPRARAALVEFIAARGLSARRGMHCDAISTELVEAFAAGTLLRREATIAGVPCQIEIAALTVAGMAGGGEGCWMLTTGAGRHSPWSWTARAFPPVRGDGEDEDEENDVVEAIARGWLRAACRADRGLALDLHAAFAKALTWFRDDWFGPVPEEGGAW